MATSPKKPSAILKRSVTIKVVVTETFKSHLKIELDDAMALTKQRIKLLEDTLIKDTQLANNQYARQQVETDLMQLRMSLADMDAKLNELPNLAFGSEYVQGQIEGFVTVSEGDNLYEKLAGLEIKVEDGIVQSITPGAPSTLA